VSVRMGRFGPFVQAGTKDDEEKPVFAGLRPGQKMDTITLDDALVLFQLPRKLGETPQGEPMTVAIGRFGPYIKYGSKYVSLKEPDDPYTVTRERAIEVIEAKKIADANRIIIDFGVDDIQVLNGRYGPYITDKQRNARIPKDRDPKTLTLEECGAEAPAAAGAQPPLAPKSAAKPKAVKAKAKAKAKARPATKARPAAKAGAAKDSTPKPTAKTKAGVRTT
jgi:DNA topoisomerase-1